MPSARRRAGARLAISEREPAPLFVMEDLQGGQLYVRPLDSCRRPPSQGHGRDQRSSPGGDWVGFFAGWECKKVRVGGDQVVTICDAIEVGPAGARTMPSSSRRRRFCRCSGPSNGGAPQPLTTLVNGETSHRWPEILPAARRSSSRPPAAPTSPAQRLSRRRWEAARRTDILCSAPHENGPPGVCQGQRIFGARFDAKSLALSGNPMSIVQDSSMNSTTGAALFAISAAGTLLSRAVGNSRSARWCG